MHRVCERVTTLDRALEIVIQIVDMHVAITEAPARRDVEITDDLIDPKSAFYPTSFLALRIETLGIPFSLALLDVLAPPKRPGDRSICFADIFASVTAASFLGVGRAWSAVAAAAVRGIEMGSYFICGVPAKTVSV